MIIRETKDSLTIRGTDIWTMLLQLLFALILFGLGKFLSHHFPVGNLVLKSIRMLASCLIGAGIILPIATIVNYLSSKIYVEKSSFKIGHNKTTHTFSNRLEISIKRAKRLNRWTLILDFEGIQVTTPFVFKKTAEQIAALVAKHYYQNGR